MEENENMNIEERQGEVTTQESWSEDECEESTTGFPIRKAVAVVGGAVVAAIIGRKLINRKKSGESNKPSFKDRVRYLIKGELPEVEDDVYDMEDSDDIIDDEE